MGNEPPVSDEKKEIYYAAHSSSQSTPPASPGIKLLPRSPGPLVPPILPTPAGNAALVASPAFDKLAFVKYVKDVGREYRREAMTSISLCQTFIKAQEQTRSSYEELRRYCSQIIHSS
jgi:hypothetical protein